jgi:hypothetical protein
MIKQIRTPQIKMGNLKISTPKLKGFEFNISKEGRIRIPAKRRDEVYKKCNNKCKYPKCKEKEILDIHHINMNARDNRLKNLILLCPTHHRKRHQEKFRKVVGTDFLTGRKRKKLVKKKSKTKTNKTKRKTRQKGLGWI